MKWYNSTNNYYGQHKQKRDGQNIVHIVTHSNIMRSYLSEFKVSLNGSRIPFDIEKIENETLKSINNSNSWHFITNEQKIQTGDTKDLNDLIKELDLKEGVPINKQQALKEEKDNISLCGTQRNVHDVENKCPRGGVSKKSRKKRYNKIKRSIKNTNLYNKRKLLRHIIN